LVYLGVKAHRRADFWEQTARNMARERAEIRKQAAPTVVAPQWHAPRATLFDSDASR